jgi:hypothetical protein
VAKRGHVVLQSPYHRTAVECDEKWGAHTTLAPCQRRWESTFCCAGPSALFAAARRSTCPAMAAATAADVSPPWGMGRVCAQDAVSERLPSATANHRAPRVRDDRRHDLVAVMVRVNIGPCKAPPKQAKGPHGGAT